MLHNRRWAWVAAIGTFLVLLPLLVVALTLADKTHFGALVGPWFLPFVAASVIAGGIVIIIGTLNLPIRRSWRGVVLLVWALVALTSPLFGLMFLLPMALLVVSLPVVGIVFYGLFTPAPR